MDRRIVVELCMKAPATARGKWKVAAVLALNALAAGRGMGILPMQSRARRPCHVRKLDQRCSGAPDVHSAVSASTSLSSRPVTAQLVRVGPRLRRRLRWTNSEFPSLSVVVAVVVNRFLPSRDVYCLVTPAFHLPFSSFRVLPYIPWAKYSRSPDQKSAYHLSEKCIPFFGALAYHMENVV